jgi:hypothetical protein
VAEGEGAFGSVKRGQMIEAIRRAPWGSEALLDAVELAMERGDEEALEYFDERVLREEAEFQRHWSGEVHRDGRGMRIGPHRMRADDERFHSRSLHQWQGRRGKDAG